MGFVKGIFHEMAEFLVAYSTIGLLVEVGQVLYLPSSKPRLLAYAQHQATLELILRDDATAEFVVVAEELGGSDAMFVDSDLDALEELLQLIVSFLLIVDGNKTYIKDLCSSVIY
jgi:hypothetical protein